MPATAAIDNETLDHLLSVVDEGPQYNAFVAIRKSAIFDRDAEVQSVLPPQLPHRRVLDGQRIHPSTGAGASRRGFGTHPKGHRGDHRIGRLRPEIWVTAQFIDCPRRGKFVALQA